MRKSGLLEPFALPPELRNLPDYIKFISKVLPVVNLVRKFGRITCREYFDKLGFKSEKIKSVFYELYGERNFSALGFIFMLAWFNQKNAGYIRGGSLALTQRMVEKFIHLGGSISYNKKVERIIVENDTAKGVILADGTQILSDYVIGAGDGYTTIYKMLEGKYVSKKVDFAFKNWELFTPIVQVSFGINKSIKSEAPFLINISKDLKIGRTKLKSGYSIMNYSFDKTMAPEGKTSIVLRLDSPWKLWKDLEGVEYQNEKKEIEKDAIHYLEVEFPGITEFIEVIDVATPKTDVRYTGVKDGAYEGFMPSKENMMKALDMHLPKLSNFYMAGQWLYPGGGLPPSAQSGKWAVQLISKKEKQKFITAK